MMLVRLALRNVLRQRRRSFLAVAVMAIATSALLFTAGFVRFSFEGLREGIIAGGLGHLELRPASEPGAPPPEPGEPDWRLEGWRALQAQVEASPHVIAAEGTLQFTGLLSSGSRSVAFFAAAVEPARERRMGFVTRMLEGEPLADEAPVPGDETVLLGRGLARAAGAGVGDVVTLVSMTSGGMMNALDVKVAGLVTTGVQELDTRFAKMHVETARRLLETEAVTSLVIGLDATENTDAVAGILAAGLAKDGTALSIRTWQERAPFYSQVKSLYWSIFVSLGIIVFLLACLSTSSTLLISVMERVREFGTLRALGTARSQIALLVLYEAGWLGALGTVAGTVAGLTLAQVLTHLRIRMPPPPGATGGIDLQILIVPADVLVVAATMFFVAAVAAVVPAVSAAFRRIVDALTHV